MAHRHREPQRGEAISGLVLAAGKGTRMRSSRPKVLHKIFNRPLLDYVLETLEALGVSSAAVVVGSGGEQVRSFIVGAGFIPARNIIGSANKKARGMR